MFNRTAFNLTPFNRQGIDNQDNWNGIGQAVSIGTATAFLKALLGGEADSISTGLAAGVGGYPYNGAADAISAGSGAQVRVVYLGGQVDALSTGQGGGLYAVGTDFITLDTALSVGDVIRIDTDKMTVTINNINAVQYLSDDSVFFLLAAGDQLDFGLSGQADIVLLWKDRWL